MPITASTAIQGASFTDAAGNMERLKRRKPYVPIFSKTPARMTEPAVGACTCASGNQVCTGHIGTFTANAIRTTSAAVAVAAPFISSQALGASAADEIRLTHGGKVEGRIVTETPDRVVIEVPYGTMTLDRKDIVEIIYIVVILAVIGVQMVIDGVAGAIKMAQ